MRRAFLSLLLATTPTLAATPNFIVILADDMGYADLSCYGNDRYTTPHLDQLAAEGLRFTDFHSNGTVCSPTRAALLTGRYPQRTGVDTVVFADPARGLRETHGLPPEEITFAELLRPRGYATAIMGKWHLGYVEKFNPIHQGFDRFRGYVSGNVDFQSHIDQADFQDWWQDLELKDEPGYTTHLINRHALDFIRQHRQQPFCLFVPHEAPHAPYQGPTDPPVRGPDAQPPLRGAEIQRAYREMVQAVDDGVGQIVALLRELQIERQTLVFFMSDNGGTKEANNGPLHGTKGTPWEGGHRVPAIAWWPGTIAAGETSTTALSMDLLPTLAELADTPLPNDVPLDGTSLAGLLQRGDPLPERTLFWGMNGQFAVREGPWKLVLDPRSTAAKSQGKTQGKSRTEATPPRLFRLDQDLAESTDLSASEPEKTAALLQKLDLWKAITARPLAP